MTTNPSERTLLQQLAETCAELKQAFASQIGLSQARYQLLGSLAQQGEVSHAVLQQQLGLDGATITRLVKQFEGEGLVRRRADPHDNRYTLASLTPAGQQFVGGIAEAHRAFQLQLLAGISSQDQKLVTTVLERVQANVLDLAEQASRSADEPA